MWNDTHLKLQFITLWTISTHKRNLDAYQLPGLSFFPYPTIYQIHFARRSLGVLLWSLLCVFSVCVCWYVCSHMYNHLHHLPSFAHIKIAFVSFFSLFLSLFRFMFTSHLLWAVRSQIKYMGNDVVARHFKLLLKTIKIVQ